MLGDHRRDLCFRREMWSFMCAQRWSIEIYNSVLCTELPPSSKKQAREPVTAFVPCQWDLALVWPQNPALLLYFPHKTKCHKILPNCAFTLPVSVWWCFGKTNACVTLNPELGANSWKVPDSFQQSLPPSSLQFQYLGIHAQTHRSKSVVCLWKRKQSSSFNPIKLKSKALIRNLIKCVVYTQVYNCILRIYFCLQIFFAYIIDNNVLAWV